MNDEAKRKLYRSRSDRYISGVCGGLAAYFNIDSNLARLLIVGAAFIGGLGIVLYIAALVLVPENPDESAEPRRSSQNSSLFWGILFIGVGAALILWEMDIFDLFYFDISWPTLWAVLLIAIGVSLMIAQYRQQPDSSRDLSTIDDSGSGDSGSGGSGNKSTASHFNIYRSRSDRKLAGVCAGLARHFNIDPTLVRLGWVLATVASKGLGVLVYLIFIFVFPEESNEQTV